jgi:hypothetical protein
VGFNRPFLVSTAKGQGVMNGGLEGAKPFRCNTYENLRDGG